MLGLTTQQARAFKGIVENLERLGTNSPREIVICEPVPEKVFPELCRKMNRVGHLPWPGRRTAVCVPQGNGMLVGVPNPHTFSVAGVEHDGAWIGTAESNRFHGRELVVAWRGRADFGGIDDRRPEDVARSMAPSMFRDIATRTTENLERAWVGVWLDVAEEAANRGDTATLTLGRAWPLLYLVAAAATPCGYSVRSRPRPFGTGPTARYLRSLQIRHRIKYDRLRTAYRDATQQEAGEVSPHKRSACDHHCWKEAGINRFALPRDPFFRTLWADKHNVRVIRRRATWVGDTCFSLDGVAYEVELDPITLEPFAVAKGTRNGAHTGAPRQPRGDTEDTP